jgi:hypothetical protein
MTAAELLAAVSAITTAVKNEPEIVAAVENVFRAQRTGTPSLSHALKHLEVLAFEKLLKI